MIGLLNNISNKKNYCSRKHHCLSANLSRCAAVQSKSLKTHSPTCSALHSPPLCRSSKIVPAGFTVPVISALIWVISVYNLIPFSTSRTRRSLIQDSPNPIFLIFLLLAGDFIT